MGVSLTCPLIGGVLSELIDEVPVRSMYFYAVETGLDCVPGALREVVHNAPDFVVGHLVRHLRSRFHGNSAAAAQRLPGHLQHLRRDLPSRCDDLTEDVGAFGMDSIDYPLPRGDLLLAVYHGGVEEADCGRRKKCAFCNDEGSGHRCSLAVVLDRHVAWNVIIISAEASQRCHDQSV